MLIAVCPGSFDPITSGHLDIILRAAAIYDKVIVGIAASPVKEPLFSVEDRLKMATEALAHEEKVVVEAFHGLLVEFAARRGARIIIKGLRAVSDFEHEFQMAQLNRRLNPETETVFMMASTKYAYLSSSAVKEIAQFGGALKELVPPVVENELRRVYA